MKNESKFKGKPSETINKYALEIMRDIADGRKAYPGLGNGLGSELFSFIDAIMQWLDEFVEELKK